MSLMTRTRAGYLAALAAGFSISFAVLGAAAAAPAAPAAPAGGMVTRHFALAASAFSPDGLHNTSLDYFNQWDPATLSNQDTGRCFNAGLALPSGATLKSVTAYYTAGSDVMFVEVSRQDLVSHTAVSLVDFDTAVASTPTYTSTTTAVPAADAAVDMKVYAYSAGVCPTGNTTFSGLVVTYTQPG